MSPVEPMLSCDRLTVRRGDEVVLDGIDLAAGPGTCTAITGPSGSGKTTLLSCLAGMLLPTSGSVTVAGRRLDRLSTRDRARWRRRRVGMVFQFGELLDELTVHENVELPLRLDGRTDPDAVRRVLCAVGLEQRARAHPRSLSGGEVQRAAIARALVHRPAVILADEPTGALDEERSVAICTLLIDGVRRSGATLIVATHDPLVRDRMDRALHLRRGTLSPR